MASKYKFENAGRMRTMLYWPMIDNKGSTMNARCLLWIRPVVKFNPGADTKH